ncbi:M28 family peptidase [Robiginitalea sp. IMCC44478]|uniref:M28 family peptidase n=1 Tax=Robiginitalea sp. IMCC44478 TaxID=3459122 RepID=UPI004041E89D
MYKYFILLTALCLGCNSTQKSINENNALPAGPADVMSFASTITEEELKEHLFTYASDDFEGRETGSAGQKKAVNYLREAYTSMDIPAAKGDAGYFQNVPLELRKLPVGELSIEGQAYSNGNGYITFRSGEGTYKEIVYLGYGIDTEQYSDYKGAELDGKIVLVRSGEPQNGDGTYLLTGTKEPSKWSNMSEAIGKRLEAAQAHGVKAVLYVDSGNYSRYMRYFNYMKTNNSGQMSLKAQEDGPQLILLEDKLAVGLYPELMESTENKVIAAEIKMDIKSKNEEVSSENVAAVIRGNTFPDEYLIISSHLDHIGVTSKGEINNGADDDGSGTVAMLEIAEAFKLAEKEGVGPKRSIVFLHVTGEEKGLLGSQYYTDFEPIFPLEKTVANLNIDMIGRIDPKREGDRNYIYLIGSDKLSTELHELSESINKRYTNIELDYTYNDENDPNRFYYRSDHYNFAKNNIPIIFYFNGTHADYHRPGDTPDKINYDLLANRTRLIFHTAWEVANRDKPVVVDKAAK